MIPLESRLFERKSFSLAEVLHNTGILNLYSTSYILWAINWVITYHTIWPRILHT